MALARGTLARPRLRAALPRSPACPTPLACPASPLASPRPAPPRPPQVLLASGAEPHVRLADFGLATLRAQADRASRISTMALTDTKRGAYPPACERARMHTRANTNTSVRA